MSDEYVNNITNYNLAMFSSGSTCNPHKNTLPGERYKYKPGTRAEVNKIKAYSLKKYKPKTFSHTHTRNSYTLTGTKDKILVKR